MIYCKKCGKENKDGSAFCTVCGAPIDSNEAPVIHQTVFQPAPPPVQTVVTAPVTESTLPERFRPLSPWAYFGLTLLYSIPVVGFVFLIINTFNGSNINRRNFTRSYWIPLIISLVVMLFIVIITLITSGASGLADLFKNAFNK